MLAPLDAFCADLLARSAPAARRSLAREIGMALRASQTRRIGQQLNADGSAYEPRRLRAKRGAIRRRLMFGKLRTAKWLKVESSPEAAVVGFVAAVQHMAQVHHYGLRDKVNRRGGPEVQYPARELLGFSAADRAMIEDMVIAHLAR